MDKITTRSLSRILEDLTDTEKTEDFISSHAEKQCRYFYEYLNQLIADKNLVVTDVIAKSGISRNYVYNILNGHKKNPGRDKIIALCIGASMNYSQIQKALEIAETAPLYPRNPRNVRIAVAVNKGVKSVDKLNLILEEYGLEPLKV